MSKRLTLLLALLPMAAALGEPASAGAGALPRALATTGFVCGKADLGANYYIYLHSASWCGPCGRTMPAIVQAYPTLKSAGFEIILAAHDTTDEQVKAYAESHQVPFPALLASRCYAAKLPGYKGVCGIPRIHVTDREGRLLYEGHPSDFLSNGAWKRELEKWQGNPGENSCSSE